MEKSELRDAENLIKNADFDFVLNSKIGLEKKNDLFNFITKESIRKGEIILKIKNIISASCSDF